MARPTQATFPEGSIFASDAAQIDQPDERWAAAYEGGEGKTPPAAGVHNYEFNRLDVFGQHLEKNGMADWDARTIYPLNGWAKGSDGMLYRSRLNGNTGNNPVGGDGTKWRSLSSITAQGMFPVGSVVFRPSNPGLSEASGGLGFGTWAAIQGRTLRGTGTTTDEEGLSWTFTRGQTGGRFKRSIGVDELPRHRHTGTTSSDGNHRHKINRDTTDDPGYNGVPKFAGSNGNVTSPNVYTDYDGSHSHDFTTSYEGSGESFDINDPYYAVDIWIRTA